MENNEESNSIKNKVLLAIETGKVKMKPRWEFVLQTILIILGAIILVLALLYLFSFIIFIMRQSGLWFIPAFGLKGVMPFLESLPWFLILLVVGAIIILEFLVKHFSFIYRKPVLYSLVGIVGMVIFGSLALANSQFHRGMFEKAELDNLPLAGELYKEYGKKKYENIAEGMIKEVAESEYVIENRRGDTIKVLFDKKLKVDPINDLQIGDVVVVIGQKTNGAIQAEGIREVKDFPSMPKRKMMRDKLPLPPGKMK